MTHTIPLHYSPSLPCILLLLLPALLLLLAISVLASCGGNAPDSESPSRTDRPAEETAKSPRTMQATEATTAASTPTQRASLTSAVPNSLYPLAPSAAALERDVLEVLYNGTGGSNWHDNENWLTDAPLGEWDRIATDEAGFVIALDLGDNRLVGQIPPELSRLASLQGLDLSSSKLSGEIPPELGSLTDLRTLALNSSNLSGQIPPELGSLVNLRTLQLDYNKLSGQIPPELRSLANLQQLRLGDNQLSGVIPPELRSLTMLQELRLDDNQLRRGDTPRTGQPHHAARAGPQ